MTSPSLACTWPDSDFLTRPALGCLLESVECSRDLARLRAKLRCSVFPHKPNVGKEEEDPFILSEALQKFKDYSWHGPTHSFPIQSRKRQCVKRSSTYFGSTVTMSGTLSVRRFAGRRRRPTQSALGRVAAVRRSAPRVGRLGLRKLRPTVLYRKLAV